MKTIDYQRQLFARLEADNTHNRSIVTVLFEYGAAAFMQLCEWQNRYEMRQRMARLDDRMLDDIGLTRIEADDEASKPFWQD